MSTFTYQDKNTERLEYFEWDNLWFDNAPDMETDRVLIIGDSISCGYRQKLSTIASGRYLVDGIGTSKAVDNPSFPALLDYFISQTRNIKVVLFNNGLHGWGLTEEEYERCFEALLKLLQGKLPQAKLGVITTTAVRKKEDFSVFEENWGRVSARNEICCRLAEKYGLPVCDLSAAEQEHPELHSGDGVHFVQEGYDFLAQTVADFLTSMFFQDK